MKVVLVLLAALVLVLVRTTIICNELNIDIHHSNNNSCCSTTTTATINTTISKYGNEMVVIIGLVFILRFIKQSH